MTNKDLVKVLLECGKLCGKHRTLVKDYNRRYHRAKSLEKSRESEMELKTVDFLRRKIIQSEKEVKNRLDYLEVLVQLKNSS